MHAPDDLIITPYKRNRQYRILWLRHCPHLRSQLVSGDYVEMYTPRHHRLATNLGWIRWSTPLTLRLRIRERKGCYADL